VGPAPLRIALVIERFEPGGGGVEGAAWRVASGLAAAGDDVHVFTRRGAKGAPVTLRQLDVPSVWQPLRVLAFSRAAAAAAPRGQFDVVHSFSRTRHQDVFRAGGGSHADFLERAYSRSAARWRRASPRHAVLLAMEARIFADESQLVQCNSEMVRDELQRRYGVPDARLAVIANGVDLERFHPHLREERRAATRASIGAREETPVWLLPGSGFRRKGVDTALRALARGREAAELWVVGRDEPRPWRALAEELGVAARVRFLGHRSDMPELYAAADALVLPTRYDAFANVCLEAAASGLPVVTTSADGAARWLGGAGLTLDEPEDAEALGKLLESLCEPERRFTLGRAARTRAESRSWEHHIDELRALYAKVRR
jgi:UDP-glucose:(heptosyl)LPS alpha-1,3-glucosyltransferase